MSKFSKRAREILAINKKHPGYAVSSEQLDTSYLGQDLAQIQLEEIGWRYSLGEDFAWWTPPNCNTQDPRAFGFDAVELFDSIMDGLRELPDPENNIKHLLEDAAYKFSGLLYLARQASPYKPLEPKT